MDFGKILSDAWKLIWKHKVLWIFGILAGCTAQGGGSSGGGSNYSSSGNYGDSPFTYNPDFGRSINEFGYSVERFFENNLGFIILIVGLIILFALLVSIVFYLLSIVGKTGMIKGVLMTQESEEKLKFSDVLNGIKPYFLRFLGLDLLMTVGVSIVLLILLVPGILIGIVLLPLLLCGLCLIIPISLLFGIYVQIAEIALVSEDLKVFEALEYGWKVFRKNLGNLVLMGLILMVINIVVGLVLAIPVLVLMIPLIAGIGLGVAGEAAAYTIGGVVLFILGLIILIPVMIFLKGLLQAYMLSAWTLTYKELPPIDEEALAVMEILPPTLEEPAEEVTADTD